MPLERNLEAIGLRFPELARELSAAEPASMDTLAAASGEPTASIDGLLLHSRYDPRSEADRVASDVAAGCPDTVVLLGMGLGYVAEAVLSRLPRARLLVAEADAAAFASCLRIRDISQLLAREEVGLLIGSDPEALFWAFDRLDTRRVAVHENKALTGRKPEWYADAKSAIERFQGKESINRNTLKKFGKLWVRNLARNAREIGRRPGVASLAGLFAGLPAIVCAAGPSLDDALPFLADARRRAVIVTVDTALRSLLHAGVEPDFVVVVDPQYWNARHLDRCESASSIMIAECAAWPSTFRFGCGATYLCSSLYPLGTFLEERTGARKGKLGAGGSVATTAWDFARTLGCSPIWMAGLDLSFPDGRTHARASVFEQRALTRGARLRPAATEGFEAMLGAGPFKAPDNSGGSTVTDKRMILYAWWFESRLGKHPEAVTRTLSAKGLAIPGMPFADVSGLAAGPDVREGIDTALDAAKEAIEDREREVAAALEGLIDLLDEMERYSRTGLELSAKAREAARRGDDVKPWLGKLDRIDGRIMGNQAKDVAGFLFPAIDELLSGRARSFEESIGRSETVYREIARAAAYNREILSTGRYTETPVR
ncbi:MAG: DUF115 domain-containing protein [Spirochaetes bacterium]|nr:DUF115 domain-containing protein [Spirochaetota bacterium]